MQKSTLDFGLHRYYEKKYKWGSKHIYIESHDLFPCHLQESQ